MSRFYITTAIPYVNASPHVGHALEMLQTDATARFWRSKLGEANVRALTGTDENSLKNVRAAEVIGEDVSSFVERHAEEYKDLGSLLNLSFDDFLRTREDRHIKGAQKLWEACDPDDIYKKTYKGLYCVGCEQFYTEKECPDGFCPEHKTELEVIEEENYFFKLSKYQKQLEDLIESDVLKIVPRSRKNEVLSFIKGGLEDFSISRSQERARNWGVPVPADEGQVMYVWFDALSNYITALDYEGDGDLYKNFWLNDDSTKVHVIGKGILRFHAVYWPAMLLSAGVPLPNEIFVHGYVTAEGEKMSKSIGNVINPKELVQEYGVDAVRYFFLREIPSHGDGDFSKDRMEERYAELANQLGNLVGRIATMSNKYFEGELDRPEMEFSETYHKLDAAMSDYDYKKYIDTVFEIVANANEMTDKEAPFKLVKIDPDKAKRVLSQLAQMIRVIANALLPIMPDASTEILRRYEGDKILIGDALFPRRDGTK
ncbi:MAG: methionine--tRNA ligase [Candidatus Uhrbacteria bacterium]|nr:methionine--tRNA ligase [Candidatus Uhrbacteria bacterium]